MKRKNFDEAMSSVENKKSDPKRKNPLGRGLDSLIPTGYRHENTSGQNSSEKTPVSIEINAENRVFNCDLERIRPNPDQPRKVFSRSALLELSQSIKSSGLVQPIVVRKLEDGSIPTKYEIIAGERRWRASRMAGLREIPIIVKGIQPQETMELALIENIQREDLTSIEEAMAYQYLSEKRGLSHEAIAKKVGRDRSTVTNTMRLVLLPLKVRQLILERKLSQGHGRAILAIENDDEKLAIAEKTVKEGLSVREVEALVRGEKDAVAKEKKSAANETDSVMKTQVESISKNLSDRIGLRVNLKFDGRRGNLKIKISSKDDLERFLAFFDKN